MITADLHIHTTFSGDSEITPERLIARVQEIGLGCIAIVDHNTASGSLKVREMRPPFKVIIGEEILTTEGELIGLFLTDTIPSGLGPEETIRLIHEQGGLVSVPHPFDRFRSSAMQVKTLERIITRLDLVEVANARTLPMQNLSLPQKFAEKHCKPMCAGSDSHTLAELGRAYVEMAEFDGPDSFLKSVAEGMIHRYHINQAAQALGIAGRIARKLTGRR